MRLRHKLMSERFLTCSTENVTGGGKWAASSIFGSECDSSVFVFRGLQLPSCREVVVEESGSSEGCYARYGSLSYLDRDDVSLRDSGASTVFF
ncbi:hypothetical protein CEXT_772521 [Caerostris extrusa]|uniref:Uncharacterized protein n=1 Tax=Caerostris extrusa TaxID=172846 RepID=A0AAV4MCM9_CAEEX|nr:hypothetical protein CEXT_772521 [Caerostris extrusa]